jgi:hypothetical protein
VDENAFARLDVGLCMQRVQGGCIDNGKSADHVEVFFILKLMARLFWNNLRRLEVARCHYDYPVSRCDARDVRSDCFDNTAVFKGTRGFLRVDLTTQCVEVLSIETYNFDFNLYFAGPKSLGKLDLFEIDCVELAWVLDRNLSRLRTLIGSSINSAPCFWRKKSFS